MNPTFGILLNLLSGINIIIMGIAAYIVGDYGWMTADFILGAGNFVGAAYLAFWYKKNP